jgi:hypothetical protein
MFSFIFGLIGKVFWWSVETIGSMALEAILF